jgi:hypothetical protein
MMQYGRAQLQRLQRNAPDVYVPFLWLAGFLLKYFVARMLSFERPMQGRFAQCSLFSFWLDISLWPFIVGLIHKIRSDSYPAHGLGTAELSGFVEA